MIMILGDEPALPYTEPRGTCPDCGSGQVIHHLLGVADPRTEPADPPWIEWHGCLPPFGDRSCEECDAIWSVGDREAPLAPMRLASEGAAFALLPVPYLQGDEVAEVDIELLTPDRLVRYFLRAPEAGAFLRLGETLQEIAEADRPELEVPAFHDEESGLAVLVLTSDPMSVTLEVQVVIDLDSNVREVDGIAFDALRADLIAAAHQIGAWEE